MNRGTLYAAMVILLSIGGIIFFFFKTTQDYSQNLDRESKIFARQSTMFFCTTFDPAFVLKNGSNEFLAANTEEELKNRFAFFAKELGSFKNLKSIFGQSHRFSDNRGKQVTANYIAKAVFEAGLADISLRLVKRDGRWQILQFQVSSKVLLQSQ